MKFFIQKIYDGEIDSRARLQFQKFSRGKFKNRAMIDAKKTSKEYNLSTTAEYANGLVQALAEKIGDASVDVTGVVVSTADLTGRLEFKDKKQFMGVKSYVIDSEMSGEKIVKLCEEFSDCFIAFSFKFGDYDLKIRPKSPKSAKPSTKNADEKPKVNFCKLKTSDVELVGRLVFETTAFKKVEISHDFIIDEIVVPEGIENPVEMRRLAKRKGKIVRRATIDGVDKVSEIEFEI